MKNMLEEPDVKKYTTDPYSARVLILKLEEQYVLSIRVYDSNGSCMICIDKEAKKEDE